jgi:hypothetical protein
LEVTNLAAAVEVQDPQEALEAVQLAVQVVQEHHLHIQVLQ